MDENDKTLLATSLKHLSNAVTAAREYLQNPNVDHAPQVLQIHVNFVVNRITGVEKTVTSINRRNKNEDLFVPDEAEAAAELVRDLQIRQAELLQARLDRDKMEAAAAAASASVVAQAAAAKASTPPPQVVIVKKPPLPPLPIPRFAGDAMDYANFMAIFDETVHKNETIGPSQKLVYLQSYVDGEAKRLIGRIMISDANYEIAKEILKSNFGNSSQTISVLYDKLHSVQRSRNDPFSIRDTYNEIESILQMLENAGVPVNSDQYLRYEVMKKWPFALVKQLVKSTDVSLEEFRAELKKEVQLQIQLTQATGYVPPTFQQRQKPYPDRPTKQRSGSSAPGAPTSGVAQTGSSSASYSQPSSSKSTSASGDNVEKGAASASQSVPSKTSHCPFCAEQHYAEQCERFATAQQRSEKLGEKRCKKCFRQVHEGVPCIRNLKCKYCPSWEHNRALCPVKYPELDSRCLLAKNQNDAAGFFMTFLAKVTNPATNKTTGVRVLIDPACNRTALTEAAASKLGISLKNGEKRATKGMGDREVEPITEEAAEILLHIAEGNPVPISTRLTQKIAEDVPVFNLQTFRKKYPQCKQYYIPPTGEGCPVDLIIGTDRMLRFLTLHKSVFVNQSCQLLSTTFGWLIMAENENTAPETQENINFFTRSEDIVKLMWDLDLVGMKNLGEPDAEFEEKALQIFYKSIKFVNGRYEIHWPWRTFPPNLNENYGLAMGRLRTLLRKLQQQPELLLAYHKIICEQISEGVLEDVPKGKPQGLVVHHIPHHAVIVIEKSTPVRIVVDAAATTGRSKSLNDNMLKGTKWLNSTVGSLLRFRKFGKAATADIRHAFHQISIAPKDRDAVRFIWVHDPTKPPQGENIRVLRFCRVAFGIVASPFLLYATIQYHLRNQSEPYAAKIAKEMYADNLLISLPHQTDEIAFYEATKKLFQGMSMDITKWKTNVQRLTQHIPAADKITEEEMSVLGLAWQAEMDRLGLRPPKIGHLEKLQPTKRIVLKTMASIFDPLGWVVPFVLRIKLFLRKLWQEKRSWENLLTEDNLRFWIQLKEEIAAIETFKTARMFFSTEVDEEKYIYEVHTFVDASAEALGTVSYLRQSDGSTTQLSFLMAKSRLSPTTKLSIPRLEFYALMMGIRLQKYVVESLALEKEIKSYIWSDSKCVLAWITSNKLLPVAIERHLPEARGSGVHQFRYVPTALNPADIASRGSSLAELRQMSWFGGPDWLRDESMWPKYEEVTCNEAKISNEEKALFIQGQHTEKIEPPFSLDPKAFSEWKGLLRRTAYCIWLLHHYIKKQILPVQTPIDYNMARMLWLRYDQRVNGSDNPGVLSAIKHFKNVQLFKDQFDVLRCRSRLQNSKLPWSAVEPIILVKGSHITELIVLDIHHRNYHVGTSHTLATLRKNYWLIHGRREVFRIIHTKCFKCKRYNAVPFKPPEIAPLPQFRVEPTSHPFENTGIDVFGPIYVYSTSSGNKEKVKRWVLLFTCLVIRAVHFEILTHLDTQDILCAIKKFTARRGTPSLILSDNAPQFHLVNGTMQELWQTFYENESANKYFAEHNLTWKFTPQSAPWMGGAYERLVGVTKDAFKRTYSEQTVNEREFSTAIVEIEAVLNTRPIAYVDKELDSQLLTPNHFLRVKFPAIPINVEERDQHKLSTKERLLSYWKATERDLNIFWRVWSDQYLLSLREIRNKATKSTSKMPKVGDIVLMVDPAQKRGYWRKGIIERLILSADQKCRSAQIKVSTGTRMIRPITKLASLELLDDLPDQIPSVSVTSGEDVDLSTDPSEVDDGPASVVLLSRSWGPVKL